ncbi:MAG: phosphotransferase [Novosphingobium sp.]
MKHDGNTFARLRPPRDWQFTPEQLTPIIAARHPGTRLSRVSLLDGSDGTSSRARIGLEYDQGKGPAAVFVKSQGDIWHRLLHFMTGNLYREALLYGSGVTIPIEHPAEYFGQADRARLNELVIMEDLSERHVTLHDATRIISVEAVADGLRELAKLHSAFWRFTSEAYPALDWVETWRATLSFRMILRGTCGKGIANVRPCLPDPIAELGAIGIERAWTAYIRTVGKGPLTLLHGDAHVGNTYRLPGGEFGFLDWACVRRGNWAFDAGYFLVSALEVEDRQKHERELVEIYRQALEVPVADLPSHEEAWLRYRSTPAYGLAAWLGTSSSANYQSYPICTNMVRRYATAFLDLDTPAAIASLS